MVGRCISYWNSPFLGDMLVSGSVSKIMHHFWTSFLLNVVNFPCFHSLLWILDGDSVIDFPPCLFFFHDWAWLVCVVNANFDPMQRAEEGYPGILLVPSIFQYSLSTHHSYRQYIHSIQYIWDMFWDAYSMEAFSKTRSDLSLWLWHCCEVLLSLLHSTCVSLGWKKPMWAVGWSSEKGHGCFGFQQNRILT